MKELLIYLIQLDLLSDLFISSNNNIQLLKQKIINKLLILNNKDLNKELIESITNLENYNKEQTKEFCEKNIQTIFKNHFKEV